MLQYFCSDWLFHLLSKLNSILIKFWFIHFRITTSELLINRNINHSLALNALEENLQQEKINLFLALALFWSTVDLFNTGLHSYTRTCVTTGSIVNLTELELSSSLIAVVHFLRSVSKSYECTVSTRVVYDSVHNQANNFTLRRQLLEVDQNK